MRESDREVPPVAVGPGPLDEEIPLPDAGDEVDDEGTARFEKRAIRVTG